MSHFRRRTRTGIPLAVVIAILTAIFVSRADRSSTPAGMPLPASPATQPAAAPKAPAELERRSTSPSSPATSDRRSSRGFASRPRLVEHFEKHGEEFPGLGIDAYLAAAQALRDASTGTTLLEVRRRDGVVSRFDRVSGAFIAFDADGTIRTFFKPNDGEAYFRRQASRLHGGGT